MRNDTASATCTIQVYRAAVLKEAIQVYASETTYTFFPPIPGLDWPGEFTQLPLFMQLHVHAHVLCGPMITTEARGH